MKQENQPKQSPSNIYNNEIQQKMTHEQAQNAAETHSHFEKIQKTTLKNIYPSIKLMSQAININHQDYTQRNCPKKSSFNSKNKAQNLIKYISLKCQTSSKINQNLQKKCQICEQEVIEQNFGQVAELCKHKANFCQSCVNQYVIYKIERFEQVICPFENCEQLLDVNGALFRNLPQSLQTKYKKIHSTYQILQDPSLKPCRRENCDGILKFSAEQNCFCSFCKTEFCKKCFLQIHEGACDDQEVIFFQKNFRYKQCKKCRMVVEKAEGCNHMTCRCKNEFCYECGKDWTAEHICGVLPQTVVEHWNDVIGRFEQEQCGFGCCLCGVLKLPLKLLLLTFYLSLFCLEFITIVFCILYALIPMYIIIGMLCRSFKIVYSLDCPLMIIFILLFPLAMIWGIFSELKDLFWEGLNYRNLLLYCSRLCHDVLNVFDW